VALYSYRLYTPSCNGQKQFHLFTRRRTNVRVLECGWDRVLQRGVCVTCGFCCDHILTTLRPVVTICTASGRYMYRQWSLYAPPVVAICTTSGHYMYRRWSLYVPPLVTICTANLTFNNSTFCPHSAFVCFVWISEQTAIISLYNID